MYNVYNMYLVFEVNDRVQFQNNDLQITTSSLRNSPDPDSEQIYARHLLYKSYLNTNTHICRNSDCTYE